METLSIFLVTATALLWGILLLLPWRPCNTKPFLDVAPLSGSEDLSDVTVLIPARNEAGVIETTLRALATQGTNLNVILVDDQSTDNTAHLARQATSLNLTLIAGTPLPPGWTGKLWALEQGRRHIATPLTLLLDADIELQAGTIGTLRAAMRRDNIGFLSLMAAPPLASFWEKLLMPAFIYFFKLLYPFRLANSRSSKVAAAAGGCILLHTRILDEIGGFNALKDALIDDCALARQVKSQGIKAWLGLTHSARSIRPYQGLREIWAMVARTAFTQLHYSIGLLMLCTTLMTLMFWVPLAGLFHPAMPVKFLAAFALIGMLLSYLPTLKFYGRSWAWALALPFIGTLYLAMTWSSAVRYWQGQRAEWKNRTYGKQVVTGRGDKIDGTNDISTKLR